MFASEHDSAKAGTGGAAILRLTLPIADAVGALGVQHRGKTPRKHRVLIVVLFACALGGPIFAMIDSATDRDQDAALSLIGTTPPEWQAGLWMNSRALNLADLRGKVVLVRWWTADCPFCSASAPALRTFHKSYGPRGLVVVGMYHHKDDGPFDPGVYRKTAKKYGFTFPLAFDAEWRTLKSWMREADTSWTSVTFILDKNGVVRYVHPGGQYVEGDPAYAKIGEVIESLLVGD